MRVFISYSRSDRATVEELAQDLESLGHAVWYDRAIEIGKPWENEIFQNILNCDLFVIALSPRTISSTFCEVELGYATDLDKRVFPVVVDNPATIGALLASGTEASHRPLLRLLAPMHFFDYSRPDRARLRELSQTLLSLPAPQPLPFPLPEPSMPRPHIEPERRLEGHRGRLECAVFSPLGDRIATTGWGGLAIVWDARTVTPLFELKHEEVASYAAFSPDGSLLLTSCWDGCVYIWDLSGQDPACLRELKAHRKRVLAVSMAPDGSTFVTASRDGTAILWDLARCVANDPSASLHVLQKHEFFVKRACFSPDGQWVVTAAYEEGGDGGEVFVWHVETGVCVRELRGHREGVYTACFHPDRDIAPQILTASRDGTARVWDPELDPKDLAFRVIDRELYSLAIHPARVYCASFSSDGKYIVTGCADHIARVWDAAGRNLQARFVGHANTILDANFSPDGKRVVTASWDRTAALWDIPTGLPVDTAD